MLYIIIPDGVGGGGLRCFWVSWGFERVHFLQLMNMIMLPNNAVIMLYKWNNQNYNYNSVGMANISQ